jgi:hypothetical protein
MPVQIEERPPDAGRVASAQQGREPGCERFAVALQEEQRQLVDAGGGRRVGVGTREAQAAGRFGHVLNPVLPVPARRAHTAQEPGIGPSFDRRDRDAADAGQIGGRVETVAHHVHPHTTPCGAADGFGRCDAPSDSRARAA